LKFRVLTYNIHRAIGFDRRYKPERIIEIIQHYNPDIVMLQEVDDDVPRSKNHDMAKVLSEALNYPHFAVGHNVKLRKGSYGNATLSRFPILREANIDLTIGLHKRRGCQHTKIQLQNGKDDKRYLLDVFNLHLGLSARERQKQAGKLLRSTEFAYVNEFQPCIVGGDFNDWRSLLRAFYIEGLGFECATDKKKKENAKAIKTYPSFSPKGGLDRIYYRGGLQLLSVQRCRLKVSKVASDHLPVIADFEFALDQV
jgi:endonuclease/exonuclease/phosphatase family metal-dependent hydrolase